MVEPIIPNVARPKTTVHAPGDIVAPSPKFIVGETYQYRNGEKCRVLAVDSNGTFGGQKFPIVSLDNRGNLFTHKLDGSTVNNGNSDYDLLPLPRKVKVEMWVNVYEDGDYSTHSKKAYADTFTKGGGISNIARLACIHIEREVTEGEGIE